MSGYTAELGFDLAKVTGSETTNFLTLNFVINPSLHVLLFFYKILSEALLGRRKDSFNVLENKHSCTIIHSALFQCQYL